MERIAELSLDSEDTWDTIILTRPHWTHDPLAGNAATSDCLGRGHDGPAKKTAQFHAAMEALPGGYSFQNRSPVAERNAKIRAILERRGQLFRTFMLRLLEEDNWLRYCDVG